MGTSVTERGCSWTFVPFLSKKICSDPCRVLGLTSRIGTNGIFCTYQGKLVSTSIFGGVHLRQIICYLFPFDRAVRSSQKRKRGATLLLSLPRYNTVFLGCTESLRFPRTTNQHQFMRQIISDWFVPMLAGGGSRHALNIAGNIHRLLVCLPSDNIARMPIQSKPNILP